MRLRLARGGEGGLGARDGGVEFCQDLDLHGELLRRARLLGPELVELPVDDVELPEAFHVVG
jgi:hypothetical protein